MPVAVDAGITGLSHVYTYRGAYLPPEYRIFRDDEPMDIRRARARLQDNVPIDPDRPEDRESAQRYARPPRLSADSAMAELDNDQPVRDGSATTLRLVRYQAKAVVIF